MAAQKRDVYKGADVCQAAQVQPYVLRSWEAEFPKLGTPGPGGAKIYGQADLDLVLQIKELVYGEGLTLAGARRRLEEESGNGTSAAAEAPLVLFDDTARERLRQVRRGLTEILDLLGSGAPQLQLVSAPAGEASAAARPVARKRKTPA